MTFLEDNPQVVNAMLVAEERGMPLQEVWGWQADRLDLWLAYYRLRVKHRQKPGDKNKPKSAEGGSFGEGAPPP